MDGNYRYSDCHRGIHCRDSASGSSRPWGSAEEWHCDSPGESIPSPCQQTGTPYTNGDGDANTNANANRYTHIDADNYAPRRVRSAEPLFVCG